MTTIEVKLENNEELSVRNFLKNRYGISTTVWKRVKNSGTFKLNGNLVNATRSTVKAGDIITYDIVRQSDIEPENIPLDIRYEDKYLLVVNKPSGMLVHPTTKESSGTLGNALLYHYQQNGESHAFHPVHRLDRDTSGLILIAKEPQVQFQLSGGEKKFTREYLAIIKGTLSPLNGSIDAPIERALPSIIKRRIAETGKPALTYYQTIKTNGSFSLVQLMLATGRTHQIRVHLAHLGHPLLGDFLYGGDHEYIERQALHAFRLSFNHPYTKELLVINSEPPADMQSIISTII